jgi:hypothetical protein
LGNLVGAGVGALLAARPELSPQDIFAALLRAYEAAGHGPRPANAAGSKTAPGRQRKPKPGSPPPEPPRAARCTQCSHPPAPGLRHCRPCLKKARRRTRRWEIRKAAAQAARQRKRPAKATGQGKGAGVARRARATRARIHLVSKAATPGVAKVRETFAGGKREVFAALDDASDGMLSRYLEKLDDGSPHLADLSRALGRHPPLRTWRQAVDAVTPAKAFRWRDIDQRKLTMVAEAIRAALEAGGGGGELARSGLGWTGLPLPQQTEAVLERQREVEAFFDTQARHVG